MEFQTEKSISNPPLEKVSGRHFVNVTTVITGSAQGSVVISSNNLDARLTAMSDFYRYYRFTRLRVHFLAGAPTTGLSEVVGGVAAYTRGSLNSAPTTTAEMVACECVGWQWQRQTESSRLDVPKRLLRPNGRNPFSWYFTQGVGDTELDQQGVLFFSTLNTSAYACIAGLCGVLIEYTCEFNERLPAGASAKRIADRAGLQVDLKSEIGQGLGGCTAPPASAVHEDVPDIRRGVSDDRRGRPPPLLVEGYYKNAVAAGPAVGHSQTVRLTTR